MLNRVRRHLFTSWSQALDDAIEALPQHPVWPHALYLALIGALASSELRFVLWETDAIPVGLAAFQRSAYGVWEPITQWLVPGLIGSFGENVECAPLLATLPFHSRIGWWRMAEAPPHGGLVRRVSEEPTFGARLAGTDYEQYWRKTKYYATVMQARRRCEALTISTNEEDAVEWVERKNSELWYEDSRDAETRLQRRLAATKVLVDAGVLHGFTLSDGETRIGGVTALIHDRTAVAYQIYRDRRFDRLRPGVRLIDHVFQWANARGLEAVDLGGGYQYKKEWAPVAGSKATVVVCPSLRYCSVRLRSLVRDSAHSLRHALSTFGHDRPGLDSRKLH